jgi:large conductance mechanosensitive channel
LNVPADAAMLASTSNQKGTTMGMLKEFKQFAMRGNVVDLAVGVIIGAAFGKIVTSVVEDILMPPVGRVVGNLDFTNLYVPLSQKITQVQTAAVATNANFTLPLVEAKKLGPVFAYGNFLTVTLNFVIVAFCIFLVIKAMNQLMKKEEAKPAPPPGPTPDQKLLTEIRDILKSK